jgi:hypothetical protein
MGRFRRHFAPLCALVIAALLASSLARLHCHRTRGDLVTRVAAEYGLPCHGHAGHHPVSDQPQHSKKKPSCAVCLALAACLPSGGYSVYVVKQVWSRLADHRPASNVTVVRHLQLGGIGSRAPPSIV